MTEQALYLQTKQEEYAVGLRSQGEPPVPPIELMEYGEPADRHLATGKQNVAEMLSALKESGFRWKRCKRVLEFGCSNGKLVRWLEPFAAGREIWGVDVQADKVMWAMENLSPPFRFATTTTVPHMPFPDGHFGLIFAGSVFTHLGELHVAWLSELTRLLAPGGFLYITLHDETAIKAASEDPSHARFTAQIEDSSFSADLEGRQLRVRLNGSLRPGDALPGNDEQSLRSPHRSTTGAGRYVPASVRGVPDRLCVFGPSKARIGPDK